MKISLIQSDLVWEDKAANLAKFGKLIGPLSGKTDIVILPEMFNTGFSMNAEHLYETPGSVTFEWMKDLAVKGNFGICGSYIILKEGKFFNSWIFVSPDGNVWNYDKRHLFSPGNEDRFFTRGNHRTVFTFREVRICPNICYDLRFPVWSRNRNDYDLLINSANWPESRRDVWTTLLKARAIENQCFVAGANITGVDGAGTVYSGESAIIGPGGDILASGAPGKECIVSGDISVSQLNGFRSKFPFLNDADDFTIRL